MRPRLSGVALSCGLASRIPARITVTLLAPVVRTLVVLVDTTNHLGPVKHVATTQSCRGRYLGGLQVCLEVGLPVGAAAQPCDFSHRLPKVRVHAGAHDAEERLQQ
eukprot:9469450-Pyramimonas_sp.AAC.2